MSETHGMIDPSLLGRGGNKGRAKGGVKGGAPWLREVKAEGCEGALIEKAKASWAEGGQSERGVGVQGGLGRERVEDGVEGNWLKLTASFAICSGCCSIQALHTCAACRGDADRQASSHHIRVGYLRIECIAHVGEI